MSPAPPSPVDPPTPPRPSASARILATWDAEVRAMVAEHLEEGERIDALAWGINLRISSWTGLLLRLLALPLTVAWGLLQQEWVIFRAFFGRRDWVAAGPPRCVLVLTDRRLLAIRYRRARQRKTAFSLTLRWSARPTSPPRSFPREALPSYCTSRWRRARYLWLPGHSGLCIQGALTEGDGPLEQLGALEAALVAAGAQRR